MRPARSISARARRATMGAALLAAALVLLVLGAPLLLGGVYFGFDLTQIDVGTMCATQRALSEGASLWLSPYLGGGDPLLLRPAAQLLYPPRWLVVGLPQDLGVSLYVVGHLAAGAAATAWLARSFGARPLGAFCAGVVFALCGTTLDLLVHTGSFALGATYLPLVWAASRRARSRRGRGTHRLVAGLGLGALLLGGEPQAFGLAAALLTFEALRGVLHDRRRPAARELLLLLLVPAALSLGALLWLGYLGEAALSFRRAGLALDEALMWSFAPHLWPAALWPPLVPRSSLPAANLSVLALVLDGPLQASTWNATPYVGPLFVAALVCGATLRRARLPLGVALGGLLLALGAGTPVGMLLWRLLPPLALFRYPSKYLLVATLAAVVVVTLCLERLHRCRRTRRHLLLASAVMLVGQLCALAVTALLAGRLDALWAGLADQYYHAALPPLSQQLLRAGLQATAPLVLALLALAWSARLRRAVYLAVVLDLLLALPYTVQLGPPLAQLRSQVTPELARRGARPPVVCVDLAALNVDPGGTGSTGWRQLALRRLFFAPELQACAGLSGAMPYASLWSSMNRRLMAAFFSGQRAAAVALGCSYAVGAGPSFFRLGAPAAAVVVARDARLVSSEEQAMDEILLADDAAVVAVLDDPLGRLSAASTVPDGSGVGGVVWDWPRPHRARVEVSGAGGAVVVLRTAFLVGWEARQAGRSLPVLRAGGQHVAAVVEDVTAGPIELGYHSPRFAVGATLSALGLAGLLLIARGRRRASA